MTCCCCVGDVDANDAQANVALNAASAPKVAARASFLFRCAGKGYEKTNCLVRACPGLWGRVLVGDRAELPLHEMH